MMTSAEFAARCQGDSEFRLAARHWDGGLQFDIGGNTVAVLVRNGEPSAEPVS